MSTIIPRKIVLLLEKKIAFITGGGSGIGQAGAKLLAKNGAYIILTDKNKSMAMQTSQEINNNGGSSESHALDVSDNVQIDEFILHLKKNFRKIDIVHSHAGVQIEGSLGQVNLLGIDLSWKINVASHFLIAKGLLPLMQSSGKASFIITASNSGVFLDKEMLAYTTTKHAAVAMTKQMALDYATQNIRFNVLCPGWVDTKFNDPFTRQMGGRKALLKYVQESIPMGRFATVEEIAEAILFLASDKSSFMTGQALVVDGGESL